MSTGLYSGVSGLALGTGLYRNVSGLWSGASGLIAGFDGLALYLDFLTTTTLDSRITFSRGSNATLVDSTGKITYAPANLLLQSQALDVTWTKAQATVSADSTVSPDGTSTADSLLETSVSNIHYAYQTSASTLSTGNTVIVSVYAKALTRNYVTVGLSDISVGSVYAVAVFNLSNGTVATSGASGTGYAVGTTAITSVGNGWYRCSVVCTVGSSVTFVRAAIGINKTGVISAGAGGMESYLGDGSGIYLWGAQLEPVTYQTTPSTYQATTSSAYYGPRFDYDPVTLAAKGLLIEEQRTNNLIYSSDFSNAAWADAAPGSTVTVAADSATAPDGSTTADKLTAATGGTNGMARQSKTLVASTSYTGSVYIKASNSTQSRILLRDTTAGTNFANATITWTAGVPSVAGGATGTWTVTSVGGDWYRITGSGSTGATASPVVTFSIWPDTSAGTNAIFVWGAQLEAGAFATSYIPTVASTVTRSADVATMTGANFSSWYNQNAGTMVCEFAPEGLTTGGAVSNVWAVNASATPSTNFIRLREGTVISGADAEMFTGGVSQVDTSSFALTANVAAKSAFAWATNSGMLAANGALIGAEDTSVTPPTVNQLLLTGGNKWLRQIAFYNTRLPNSTLQSLTS